MKTFFAKAVPFILSLVMFTACNNTGNTPAAEISEAAPAAAETSETSYYDPYDISDEGLSDCDKAIKNAAEFVDEKSGSGEILLYDLNFDGIPELVNIWSGKDGYVWDVYLLTGDEAELAGTMYTSYPPSHYKEEQYYPDGLTLESGVHIFRDRETDEIFYVTEYSSELHTEGFARGVRYDMYSDTLAETVLYDCRFDTWDDCGASGNRYIYLNVLDGRDALPMYRADSQAEGFLFCEGFADYLSRYEYLGMIDDSERCKERDGSFFGYAAKVKIPEKTKDPVSYADTREKITVCGQEVYKDAYDVELEIGYGVIGLSELSQLEDLRVLHIYGNGVYDLDISPLAEINSLKVLDIYGISFSEDDLAKLDQVEKLSDNMCVTAKTAGEMKSLKCAHIIPDEGESYSTLDLGGCKNLEAVRYNNGGGINAPEDMSMENTEKNFPDILFIYVP